MFSHTKDLKTMILENKVFSAVNAYFLLQMPKSFYFLSEIYATKSHNIVPDMAVIVSILRIDMNCLYINASVLWL